MSLDESQVYSFKRDYGPSKHAGRDVPQELASFVALALVDYIADDNCVLVAAEQQMRQRYVRVEQAAADCATLLRKRFVALHASSWHRYFDWRGVRGHDNNKQHALKLVRSMYDIDRDIDDHEADAILIAVAAARLYCSESNGTA